MPGQFATDVVAANGSKRDLSDILTVVDAKNTPFTSMVPKEQQTVENLLMEWPVDKNEDPSLNATVDGEDVSAFDNALGDYAVLQGRMQWFRRAAMVSKLAQQAQNQAGVKDKKAKAIAKKIIQLKRDMETALCSDQEVVVGTGTVANMTRGIGKWLQATAQSTYAVPTAYLTPSASINTTATASLAESDVQAVMQSQYEQTGVRKTYSLLCGTALKARFKDFTQTQFANTNVASAVRMYTQDLAAKKIVASVDVYEGDFGTYELIPTLWNGYWDATGTANSANVRKARGYALDMEHWTLRSNQKPQVQEYPDLGGGPRFAVDAVCGLICWNPLGEGKFAATS